MAGKNTSYTHRHWRIAATDIRDALDTLLVPALTHMHAGLQRVEAGRTQLVKAAEFITMAGELGTEGSRILAGHDQRLRRVGEAQAAAGGLGEVAGSKRYHQH